MKPYLKSLYSNLVVAITTCATLTMPPAGSWAEEMSMDVVQAKFEQETGKSWKDATAEEKRNFVAKFNPPKVRQDNKTDNAPTGDAANQMANIEVRTQFQRENNKDWERATPEEQEAFLQQYQKKKKKENQEEARAQRKKKTLQRKQEMQRRKELRNTASQKRKEEQSRIKAARGLHKQRDAEQRKLKAEMRKLKKMRRDMQRKHR